MFLWIRKGKIPRISTQREVVSTIPQSSLLEGDKTSRRPHLEKALIEHCSVFLSAWAKNQPVIFGKVPCGDGRPGSCYCAERLSFLLVLGSNDTKRVRESRAACLP